MSVIREDPKTWNWFTKICVFILTCWNFSYLQSILHLMQHIYWDVFSIARKFLKSSVLMPLSASAVFCFTFTPWVMFLFEDFFHQGKPKKKKKNPCLGWDWVNREGRGEASSVFGQKLLNTQHSVGRCAHKSSSWNGQTHRKVFKTFTESECSLSQQRQLVHWYRWIPRTLT